MRRITEVLRLLDEREGWDAVRAMTGKIVQGLDAYTRDVSLLLEEREAMGRRLGGAFGQKMVMPDQ